MPEYVLEIVEGPEAGRRISLDQPLELGRDPAAGGPLLQDELVSRRHVRITPVEDGARIEDLDSRNGTFVDGDQIYDPAHLAVGGQLLVGVTLLELRPAEEAAGLTSVRRDPVEPDPVSGVAGRESRADDGSSGAHARHRGVGARLRACERARQRLVVQRAPAAARHAHQGQGSRRADRDLRARGAGRDPVSRAALAKRAQWSAK